MGQCNGCGSVKNDVIFNSHFMKQVFLTLISFTGTLTHVAEFSDRAKCMSLNNEQCIAKPTLIDLN